MRKLKLLLMACALFGAGTAWADDVYKDVTSAYLTNADFEGEYTVYSNPSTDRAIYQPTGWTISYTSGDPTDMTALNSSCLMWNSNFSGKAQLADGGNNTYWVRMRWGTGAVLELSQNVTLPEGSYKLTAAYYKNGSGGDGYILVNSTEKNTSVNEDVWKSLTIDFTSDGVASTKIGCKAKHTNTYEKFLAFDNFVLEWNLTAALNSLITKANEVYNEDTSNTALGNAIDAANAVKDSQDVNELETAYNNLKTVAALALNRKAWKEAKDAAEEAYGSNDYANITGAEKVALKAEIDKDEPSDADGYDAAKISLLAATNTFTAAKDSYDAYVAAKAAAEGVDEADVLAVVIANNDAATAADALAASIILPKAFAIKAATAENSIVTDFVVNGTFDNGISPWQRTGTYQNNKTANNKAGDFTGNFYENWNGEAQVNKMYQTINNIPNGTYKLKIAAFVSTLADPNESQFVFANSDKTYLTTVDPTFYEVWTVIANNTVEIGLDQTIATANWMGIDNVSLNYYGVGNVISAAMLAEHKAAWQTAVSDAQSALQNTDYANVTGNERTAVETELAKVEPTTVEGYDQAAQALRNATQAFTAAKLNYDKYATEKARAIAMGVAEEAIATLTIASDMQTVINGIIVQEDAAATANYTMDGTEIFGTWTQQNTSSIAGQHWSDDPDVSYVDKYDANGFTMSITNTVELPAGSYVLKAAARAADGGVWDDALTLQVTGEPNAIYNPHGDSGYGIDVDGKANYSAEGTYCNNGAGRGWEWRFIPFTLTEEKEVTMKIQAIVKGGNWASFSDVTLLTTENNIAIAKNLYEKAKTAAEAARDNEDYVNVAGAEKKALTDAIGAEPTETAAWYSNQATVLNNATAVFIAAKDAYDGFIAARTAGSAAPNIKSDLMSTIATAAAAGFSMMVSNKMVVVCSEAVTLNTLLEQANGYDLSTNETVTASDLNAITESLVPATEAYLAAVPDYERAQMVVSISKSKLITLTENASSKVAAVSGLLTTTTTTAADLTDPSNDAITALVPCFEAAAGKTIGFAAGEYAPYTNLEGIVALYAAREIGSSPAKYTNQEIYTPCASLLSYSWIVNETDMDIIYNGTFAEIGTGNNPKGWSRSNNGWGQQITGLTAEINGVNAGTTTAWYYNNNGAWEYGNNGGYIMPLEANTAYKLSFKYAKHGNDGHQWMKATVISSDNTEVALDSVQYPGSNNSTMYKAVAAYFTTGSAGNYILRLEQNGNVHLTDVCLEKTASTTYALSEEAEEKPSEFAFYEKVTLTRTLKAGIWNTFSVPFDAAIPDGWTVKKFDSAVDNVINFTGAESLEAGVPYLVQVDADENPEFNDVIVENIEGETKGEGNYQFAAQIYNKTLATDGTVAYLTTDGKIRKLTSGGIKGLRAYFIILDPSALGGEARIAFTDGEQTGITEMQTESLKNIDGMYDLSGRRVQSVKKGIYVVNGKKVVK